MDNKKKKEKKKKNNINHTRMRLPKEDLYFWKILESIVKDARDACDVDVRLTRLPMILDDLEKIIRRRDVLEYIKFCDKYSLTQLNKEFKGNVIEQSVREIRWICLLTLGKKFDFTKTPFDKERAAIDAFEKYEDDCKWTNLDTIFRDFRCDDVPGTILDDIFYTPILRSASEFMRRVLGDEPMLQEVLSAVHHGPGATTMKKGNDSLPIRKFVPPIEVTSPAKDLLAGIIQSDMRWTRSIIEYFRLTGQLSPWENLLESQIAPVELIDLAITEVNESRILFVPKNSKTLRTIAAEPTGNVYIQLAINTVIRDRLKRVGIDISTQEKNQNLAMKGSISGDLVTIDLSGASDTIALAWLNIFPPRWAHLLNSLRCSVGDMNGKKIHFEKLSSMGNGYTFCIETLIFSALIYGVLEMRGMKWEETLPNLAVYGDDMIVPRTVYGDLVRVLRRFGFSINTEKSFSSGPIRESCGADFFNGQLITKPSLKTNPKSEWELIRDHNLLFLLSFDYGLQLKHTLSQIEQWLPKAKAFIGPIVREELTSWLFRVWPDKDIKVFTTGTLREATDLQEPVCVGKQHRVTLPDLRDYPARIRLEALCFSPMMYLTFDSNPANVSKFLFKISNSHPDSFFFNKLKLKCTTSKIIYPLSAWVNPRSFRRLKSAHKPR